jgi:hypothetical protein
MEQNNNQTLGEWLKELMDNPPAPNEFLIERFREYQSRKMEDKGSASIFELGINHVAEGE